jgi:hypothetical protein
VDDRGGEVGRDGAPGLAEAVASSAVVEPATITR